MKIIFSKAFSCLITFLIIHHSITAQPLPIGVRIFHENDFVSPFAPNEDDNYTGGVKAEVIFKTREKYDLLRLFKNFSGQLRYHTIAFSGTGFTPRNLDSSGIVKDDRPYSSLIAFSFGSQYISTRNPKSRFGYELLAGKMGDPAVGKVQGKIHRREIDLLKWVITDRPDPLGWQNQIANGGAWVVNLGINHEKMLWQSKPASSDPEHFRMLRLTMRNNFNAGNYLINTSHGIRANIVNINYGFGNEVSPPEIIKIAENLKIKTRAYEKPRLFSFSIYAEPRIRINIHNAGLTGKLLGRESAHTIYTTNYASGLNPVLFEYDMGFVLRAYLFQIGFSLSGRSKEFLSQNKDMHNWCGVYFAIVGY